MADEPQSISDDLIDELVTTAIGNIRPVRVYPEWQPIETAPCDGRWVLVFHANGKANIVGMPLQPLPIVAYFDRNAWNDGTDPLLPPTYWMPLPEPPAIAAATRRAETCNRLGPQAGRA